MSKKSSPRPAGSRCVSLVVSKDYYTFARAMAEEQGYLGPDYYLADLLNTAILAEINKEASGSVELAIPAELEDLDDGIPF